MKKIKEDIPHKFWKEYESLGILEKAEKIKPIVSMIDKLHDLKDDKLRKHALSTSLQGYFDDLIDYMESKKQRK